MIGFALPWVLATGFVGAAGVVALHLLSVRRPPELLLPTARFLPDVPVRAVARTRRPSDVLLLAVRVLALLCAAAAAARPTWRPAATTPLHLVVVDRSVALDSVALLALAGVPDGARAALVRLDDAPNAHGWPGGLGGTPAAAFPAAHREVRGLAGEDASSGEVVLRLVLPAEGSVSLDGWRAWRRTWPGAVRLSVAGAAAPAGGDATGAGAAAGITVVGGARDDVVREAVRLFAARLPAHGVPVVIHRSERAVSEPASQAEAAGPVAGTEPPPGATAHIDVHWPDDGIPAGWDAVPETEAGAIVTRGRSLVAPFVRRAVPRPKGDSGLAIAWWSDGTVAVLERPVSGACRRDVGIPLAGEASGSDLLLHPEALALLSALVAPCGVPRMDAAAVIAAVEGMDGQGDVRGRAVDVARVGADGGARSDATAPRRLGTALLALALLLLLVEWVLRDRGPGRDPASERIA